MEYFCGSTPRIERVSFCATTRVYLTKSEKLPSKTKQSHSQNALTYYNLSVECGAEWKLAVFGMSMGNVICCGNLRSGCQTYMYAYISCGLVRDLVCAIYDWFGIW